MKKTLLHSFLAVSLLVSVQAFASETDSTQEKQSISTTISNAVEGTKNQGFDSFAGVKYQLHKFGSNTISATMGLSIFKILQGKWAAKDIFMPNLDLTVPFAGTSLAWTLRFKPLTLLTDGGWSWSTSIKRFMEKNDRGVLAAFLAFYWYQFCGGSKKFFNNDASLSESQKEHRRTFAALSLALLTSYAVKNVDKLGGKGAALLAAAAFVTSLPRTTTA